jgi:hypothetical protein
LTPQSSAGALRQGVVATGDRSLSLRASRLEQAAEPGGILVPSMIRDQLTGHDIGRFTEAGAMHLESIGRPIHTALGAGWSVGAHCRSEAIDEDTYLSAPGRAGATEA